MKITKSQLRKIIKEELSKSVNPLHMDVRLAADVLRSLSESVLPGDSKHMTYEELGKKLAASGLEDLSDREMYDIQIEPDGITFQR